MGGAGAVQNAGDRVTIPLTEPFDRFADVFASASATLSRECFPEVNAMSLATADTQGRPSNRIVLLKGFDTRGFVFYTNFDGRKGRELLANPFCALCFHWPPIEVQVRVEGAAEPVGDSEADAYFATRARESQLGAWASMQSRPMQHADDLDRRLREFAARFDGVEVPRPSNWSGFRVVPSRIEFWHSRPGRLHDRVAYDREADGWRNATLYP